MFQQFKNIDTAFKHIRLFTLAVILASACVTCFAVYKSYQLIQSSRERIYILAHGKALQAFSAERKDNIPVEARDHVKMFHHYFFTLSPDEKVIVSQISKALYMADGSAKAAYDNIRESGYYTQMVSANINQKIQADSIVVSIKEYPYSFKYYGTQKIIRSTSIVTRRLITQGYLRHVDRSDHNPHGFLIEEWETVQNNDLSIKNR